MAIGTPTAIGSDGQNNSTGNTNTITVPVGGVPQNALVVVRCTARTGNTPTSVVDSRGNTYTIVTGGNRTTADSGLIANIAYAVATTALISGDTITITYSGSVVRAAVADYVTGIATSTPQDEHWNSSPSTGSFGTAVDFGTAASATAQADEIIICCVCDSGVASTDTLTAGTGYTALPQVYAGTTRGVLGQYKIASATETPHPTATLSSSADWCGVSVAFKALTGTTVTPAQGVDEERGEIVAEWTIVSVAQQQNVAPFINQSYYF